MKKRSIIISGVLLISLTFFYACNLIPGLEGLGVDNLLTTTYTPEEAKVEIRNANQEITTQKDEMFNAEGVSSLVYLFELMSGEELKSTRLSSKGSLRNLTYTKALNYFRGENALKSAKLDEENGFYAILEYDFDTQNMEQVAESDEMLQMSYPADETANFNRELNAVLTIWDLEFDEISSYGEEYDWDTDTFVEVETTEEIPVKGRMKSEINGVTESEGVYNASYTDDGLPQSVSCSLECGDYQFEMSFSGSGTNYKSSLSHKLNKETIMGYDLDITYTSDLETLSKMEGEFIVASLKLEGSIDAEGIINATENAEDEVPITTLNAFVDITVYNYEDNAKIGVVEFVMVTDEWGDEVPDLAIVYSDGTYELLEDIFTFIEEV